MEDGYDDVDSVHVDAPSGIVDSATVHAVYDETSNDSLAAVVVDAVASAVSREPLEIEPLYRRIDPDALESLFASSAAGDRRGILSFVLEEHLVTVVDGVHVYVASQ